MMGARRSTCVLAVGRAALLASSARAPSREGVPAAGTTGIHCRLRHVSAWPAPVRTIVCAPQRGHAAPSSALPCRAPTHGFTSRACGSCNPSAAGFKAVYCAPSSLMARLARRGRRCRCALARQNRLRKVVLRCDLRMDAACGACGHTSCGPRPLRMALTRRRAHPRREHLPEELCRAAVRSRCRSCPPAPPP